MDTILDIHIVGVIKMTRVIMSSLAVVATLSTVSALTLKESVQESILTNSEILSNNLDVKASKKEIRKEESGYYPTIDFDTYYEKSQLRKDINNVPKGDWEKKDGYRATLSVEQLIYDGGKTPSKISEKEYLYKSNLYNTTYKNENIILDIVKAYISVVKNNELLQVLKYSQEAHAEALEIAYNKEEISGEVLETKKTQAMISTVTDRKLSQEIEAKKSISEFKKLTTIESVDNVCRPSIDESVIPETLEEAIEIALENNLMIKEQIALIKKQKEIISQENANYKPKITLNLESSYDDDLELAENGVQEEISGQIKLNWNFFSGGRDKTSSQKEKLVLLKEKKTLEKITSDVKEQVTNLYNTYMQTKKRIENFDDAIKINREILDITNIQLEDGTKTFIDALQAKTKVLDAQSNKIKQEFILLETYFELLNQLSLLGKTILTDEKDVCNITKVENLIAKRDDKDNSLDELLDESIIDKNSSENVLDENNTSNKNNNTAVSSAEDLGMDDEEFVTKLAKIFEDENIKFNVNNLSTTLQITSNSFTLHSVNKKDRFSSILDSFSLKLLKFLNENKDKIKSVKIESYTSSEYRKYNTEIEKFNANVGLSQRRANKVKKYFTRVAAKNNLDPLFVNIYFNAIGKGPVDLIRNDDGTENVKASRRIIIRIIKK